MLKRWSKVAQIDAKKRKLDNTGQSTNMTKWQKHTSYDDVSQMMRQIMHVIATTYD